MATKKKSRSAKSKSLVKKEVAKPESKAGFTPSGIRIFIQEVQAEFNKVVWPQKKVTMGLTGLVILLVVLISLYLGAVDLLLGKFVTFLLNN
ncbi:MAG: preprotein translocase subunit SecE [Desulfobulbus propionicus]|nr:MAG: preprotein translocase subunit SecE [Desulfobulbus propionicus]PIE60786.1 MAG: preprotein translocase subunit SecE [Desulfobulbus propionicus]